MFGMKPDDLVLGGITPFSTLDFPGRLSAVLYTQGCSLRCRYCHNPGLRTVRTHATLAWSSVHAWLYRRRGLLDGVVFSGGEATEQTALLAALCEVRSMGFASALHTAGIHSDLFHSLLPNLDWVGMDIKAPFDRYVQVTGVSGSGEQARQSLHWLLSSGIDYELRTTMHHLLLSREDMLCMAKDLHSYGIRRWVLQEFRTQGCVDAVLSKTSSPLDMDCIAQMKKWVPNISLRAAKA